MGEHGVQLANAADADRSMLYSITSNRLLQVICGLIPTLLLSVSGYASNPTIPWSRLVYSENGRFVLALVSPRVEEQQRYIRQSRELWQKGGIPRENVNAAKRTLNEEIASEAKIRRQFKQSGLYAVEPSLRSIWSTDFYDSASWIKVANDGSSVVVGKWVIPGKVEERALEFNPDVKEVIRVTPILEAEILFILKDGQIFKAFTAADLLPNDFDLKPNTDNNFLWGSEGTLAAEAGPLNVRLRNGTSLEVDLTSGTLLSKSSPQPSTAQPSSTEKGGCLGVAILFFLALNIANLLNLAL